jgi:hypothetical protein
MEAHVSQATTQDTGLARRGLLLLGLMTGLAAVVVLIILQRPQSPATSGAPPDPALEPSAPGWEIRYNAALALARRGSPSTPWPIIREMLDEQQQRRNFQVTLQSGKVVPDEEAALRTVYNTIGALGEWHKKQDAAKVTVSAELRSVYAQVDRLAEHSNTQIRVHADRVRQNFVRP